MNAKKLSIEEGYWITRNDRCFIDLEYWSSITGRTIDEILDEAAGKYIFLDPESYALNSEIEQGWVPIEIYLSGNLYQKYEVAVDMNEKNDGLFEDNIRLLKKHLPEKIMEDKLYIKFGASWIPAYLIIEFVQTLLKLIVPPNIRYDKFLGRWLLEWPVHPNKVNNFYTYGTERLSAVHIIEHLLLSKPIKIYDYIPRFDRDGYKSIFNKIETSAALEKADLIIQEWNLFCLNHREVLEEAYMKYFGFGIVKYDGSYIDVPGLNPEITLYPHQKNAIARMLSCQNTLIAHEVGSGKTYSYCCGVHKLISLGLTKKAVIVVPNATLHAVYNTYKHLFSDEKTLLIAPKDFQPAKRARAIDAIKSNDCQIVFIAYSSFNMFRMSKHYSFAKKDEEIRMCRAEIAKTRNYHKKRQLESVLKTLTKQAKEWKETFNMTETACFDELGIDLICLDEGHSYVKNIDLPYCDKNIIGLHAKGAKSANALLEKVDYMNEIGGRAIIVSGTIITNSLTDLYVFQRFLQPVDLKIANIYSFHDWVSVFAEENKDFELDVTCQPKFASRFNRFNNLPELMAMFSQVCDFYQDPIKENLPSFNGYTNILVKKNKAQKEFYLDVKKRADAIWKHEVEKKDDNFLKLCVEERMATLDFGLINSSTCASYEESKVKVAARYMSKLYFDHPETTQICFSDLGTPKKDGGYNVYDALKQELVSLGVSANEIAYVHDLDSSSKREKAEREFNSGKLRIMIGSTQKLGTGTNVQNRLLAIHHLDVPWRPSDMTQREGRILRQGNFNKEVFIFRYITEDSFDAYTYQVLDMKQRFIVQFLSGLLSQLHRSENDCTTTAFTYGEIVALISGNDKIKERIKLKNQLDYLRMNHIQKRKELEAMSELIQSIPAKIELRERMISNAKMDLQFYQSTKEKLSLDERTSFGGELLYALKMNNHKDTEQYFSDYHGFQVILPKHMSPEKPYVYLYRKNSNKYAIKMDGDKPLGCSRRLDFCLERLSHRIGDFENVLNDLKQQRDEAQKAVDEGNIFEEKIALVEEQLKALDTLLEKAG